MSTSASPDPKSDSPEGATPAEVVQAMWDRDNQAHRLGIEIVSVELATVTVQMTVDDRHVGDHGLAHGGVLFTLADVAMAYACNAYDIHALATGASINFVDSGRRGETLTAHATEHSLRGRAGIYDVTVRSQSDDRLVATFRGNTLRVGGSVVDLVPADPV